jgi:hypothetical protein
VHLAEALACSAWHAVVVAEAVVQGPTFEVQAVVAAAKVPQQQQELARQEGHCLLLCQGLANAV